jgi:hypothetical protein
MTESATSRASSSTKGGFRTIGIITMVAGIVFAVVGAVAYIAVQQTLADQKIVVADDADFLAGDEVDGPFSAYAQAMVIGEHAKDIGGGKTYAELPRDDPNRDAVMDAAFLQASLFTSVVAFGVAAMAFVLGIVLALIGRALMHAQKV